MNETLFDILETCLQELEQGVEVEALLARHPEHAEELRPILGAALQARAMQVPQPSADVVRRNRAKLLQRAAEMRETKTVSRKRFFPLFQRLAISFALLTLFLASGTRLVHASSAALPGENLYPVKRTWEGVQLFFMFNSQAREVLQNQFEVERLDEVNELIAKGRGESIQFAGVFRVVNNKTYVSGIQVIIPATIQIPADGSVVMISGSTNAQGFVEITSLIILPDGSIVPVGQPIEIENEADANSDHSNTPPGQNQGQDSNSSQGSGEAGQSVDSLAGGQAVSSLEMSGTVDSVSGSNITVNGRVLSVESFANVQVNPGDKVEVKGYFDKNGQFVVTEIKVESSNSGNGGNGDAGNNSGSGSGGSSGGGDNSGSGDDHGGGSDNSGSGGGGSDDH